MKDCLHQLVEAVEICAAIRPDSTGINPPCEARESGTKKVVLILGGGVAEWLGSWACN